MMDDIPGWAFVGVGVMISIYSTFVSLQTDFMRFIFFFITAAVVICFGMIKMIFIENKSVKKYEPPANPYNNYAAPNSISPNPSSSFYPTPQTPLQYRQPAMAQQRVNPAVQIKRYQGFYSASAQPQKSRFHDAVRNKK